MCKKLAYVFLVFVLTITNGCGSDDSSDSSIAPKVTGVAILYNCVLGEEDCRVAAMSQTDQGQDFDKTKYEVYQTGVAAALPVPCIDGAAQPEQQAVFRAPYGSLFAIRACIKDLDTGLYDEGDWGIIALPEKSK